MEDTPSGGMRVHVCVYIYARSLTENKLPFRPTSLAWQLLPVALQPHPPALRVPPAAPHLALSPHSSSLHGGDHIRLAPQAWQPHARLWRMVGGA